MMKLLPLIALFLYLMNPVIAYGEADTKNAGPLTIRCYQAFDSFSSLRGQTFKAAIDKLDKDGLEKLEESIANFIEITVRSGVEPKVDGYPGLKAVLNILMVQDISKIPELLTKLPDESSQEIASIDPKLQSAITEDSILSKNKKFIPHLQDQTELSDLEQNHSLSLYMDQIKRKEWWLKLYRRLSGKTKNFDEQFVSRGISRLEHHIKLREFGSAMKAVKDNQDFQEVFRQVELGMIAIKTIFLESVVEAKRMAATKVEDENIQSALPAEVPVMGAKENSILQVRLQDLKLLLRDKTDDFLKTYPLYQGLMKHLNTIVADSDCKVTCKSAVLTFLSQVGVYGLPDSVSLDLNLKDLEYEFGSFVDTNAFEAEYQKLLETTQQFTMDFHKEINRFANQPDHYLRKLDFQISRQIKSLWKWVYTGAIATNIIDFALNKVGIHMAGVRLPYLGKVSIPGVQWLYRGHQAERAQSQHFGDLYSLYRQNIPIEKKIRALEEFSLQDSDYLVSAWQEANIRGMLIKMIKTLEEKKDVGAQYELFLKNLMIAKQSYLKLGGVASSDAPGTISSMTRNAGLTVTLATAFVYFTGSLTTFVGNPDDLSLLPNLIDSLGIDHIQGGARWVMEIISGLLGQLGHEGLGVSPGDLEGIIDGVNVDEYKE